MSSTSAPAAAPIVLIDDNPDDLLLLQRLLVKASTRPIHVFQRAHNAMDFIRTWSRRDAPSASELWVFCDLRMPEMDGFAMLQSIRADAKLGATRFIMVSGCALQDDVEKSQALGADGYVEKMPSDEALRDCLTTPSFPATGTRAERFRAWNARHR